MDNYLKDKIDCIRLDCEALRQSINRLVESEIREKTILILLSHHTKLPQKYIKKIIDGLQDFETEYFGIDEDATMQRQDTQQNEQE